MRFSLMNLRASITVGGCKATSAASSHLRELALHSYSAVLRYNVTTHHRGLPGLFGSHAHSRGFVIHQGCVYEGDFCRNSNSSLQFPMSAHTLRYRQVDTSRVHVVTPSETPACPLVIYTNRRGTTSAPFHQRPLTQVLPSLNHSSCLQTRWSRASTTSSRLPRSPAVAVALAALALDDRPLLPPL